MMSNLKGTRRRLAALTLAAALSLASSARATMPAGAGHSAHGPAHPAPRAPSLPASPRAALSTAAPSTAARPASAAFGAIPVSRELPPRSRLVPIERARALIEEARNPGEATAAALKLFHFHTRWSTPREKAEEWGPLGDAIHERFKHWHSYGPAFLASADPIDGLAELTRSEWHSPAWVYFGTSGYGLAIRESDGQAFVGYTKPDIEIDTDGNSIPKRVDYQELERLEDFLARWELPRETRPGFEKRLGEARGAYDPSWLPSVAPAGPLLWRATDLRGQEVLIRLLPKKQVFQGERWGRAIAVRDGRRVGSLDYHHFRNGALQLAHPTVSFERLGQGLELLLAAAILKAHAGGAVSEVHLHPGSRTQSLNEFPLEHVRKLRQSQP